MAMAGRMKSSAIPLLKQIVRSAENLHPHSEILRPVLPQLSRNFAASSGQKEKKVKVPLALFGGTGNYASALFISAKRANAVDSVEAEMLDLVEASKRSNTFSQFTKDLSVPASTRVKAVTQISAEAKFSDVFKNFLIVLAENGRLRYIEDIAKKYSELSMAERGEINVIVTSVIPLPPEEEKELKQTMVDILGAGKKVKLQQKIDRSIMGGIIVEFDQKVFDMSIKTRARQMERLLREPINIGSA